MKFYYMNQLVRTSKNHHYTHAVVQLDGDKVVRVFGCNGSKELAQKLLDSEISKWESAISNNKNYLKAKQDGKDKYLVKGRGYAYYMNLPTEEEIQKWIAGNQKHLEEALKLQIVELEER